MSFLWHRLNRDPLKRAKQCYYEYHCLVCYLRLLAFVLKLGVMHQIRRARILKRLLREEVRRG
jgi:hypothetical protein